MLARHDGFSAPHLSPAGGKLGACFSKQARADHVHWRAKAAARALIAAFRFRCAHGCTASYLGGVQRRDGRGRGRAVYRTQSVLQKTGMDARVRLLHIPRG